MPFYNLWIISSCEVCFLIWKITPYPPSARQSWYRHIKMRFDKGFFFLFARTACPLTCILVVGMPSKWIPACSLQNSKSVCSDENFGVFLQCISLLAYWNAACGGLELLHFSFSVFLTLPSCISRCPDGCKIHPLQWQRVRPLRGGRRGREQPVVDWARTAGPSPARPHLTWAQNGR